MPAESRKRFNAALPLLEAGGSEALIFPKVDRASRCGVATWRKASAPHHRHLITTQDTLDMKGLGNHIDHGSGDLLMSGCIRMIAVIGQIVSLVEFVVRALECCAKVDICGAALRGRRLDDGVHPISHRVRRVDVGGPLGLGILTAEPHTPVVQQH